MAVSVNCSKCGIAHPFPQLNTKWSAQCGCQQIVLAPILEGYKYVEGPCSPVAKIYRLKESSGWFTCRCCNEEYIIDLQGYKKIGKEMVFFSERTTLLCKKKREELAKLKELLKEPTTEVDELEREVEGLAKKLQAILHENNKLAAEKTVDDRLEKAEAIRKQYLQQIEDLNSEMGDSESSVSEYETKMLAQLTRDLLQLKLSLAKNTNLNEERVKEYAHYCSEIDKFTSEDEKLLEECEHLEAYVEEARSKLNGMSDEYKAILRAGDTSMVTADYEEQLKQKEQQNAILAERVGMAIGEVTKLAEELYEIKKEADEKWEAVFSLVKQEEEEQRASEERRMESSQLRLLTLTIYEEED